MTMRQALGNGAGWDTKILATDINTQMIAAAQAGVYPAERGTSIPQAMKRLCIRQGDENIQMPDTLKTLIAFKPLNLFDNWPMKGPFDAIFCRNVVIYFDNAAKRTLFDRFADMLAPEGYMFIGHSESLFQISCRFCLVGRTIYRRVS